MIKLIAQVLFGLLLFVVASNIFTLLLPILTHPITTSLIVLFVVLMVRKLVFRGVK